MTFYHRDTKSRKTCKINLQIYSLRYPPYSYGETLLDQYRTQELQSPKLPKIYTEISANADEHFFDGSKNTNHNKKSYSMVKNVIQGYILGAKVFTEIATLYLTKFT